jgi:regulator of protease activity HflC (stomatin/prohibitin superfamily)
MIPRALRRLAPLALLALAACRMTTSTEVGVRTNLLGITEKRGDQETYAPGGIYLVLPVVNAWAVLPTSQQNLLMTADLGGDRPVPDDVTFKTKDGNNVYIDVNVMWRIDPRKAGFVVSHVGQTADEVKERVVRPVSRSIIRDVFNEITSEEYYQVTVKNRMAETAKEQLSTALAPLGVAVDMLQLHQHRFDPEYQEAINAQKQAEADVQMLVERQKAVVVQKQTELEGKRSEWNQKMEAARGEAGSVRNEADGYYQTQTNQAKAIVVTAQAEADGVRKEAEALSKLGGDAYVKMQVSKRFADKRIYLVPGSNVSTLDVNSTLNFLMKDAASKVGKSSRAAPAARPAEDEGQ